MSLSVSDSAVRCCPDVLATRCENSLFHMSLYHHHRSRKYSYQCTGSESRYIATGACSQIIDDIGTRSLRFSPNKESLVCSVNWLKMKRGTALYRNRSQGRGRSAGGCRPSAGSCGHIRLNICRHLACGQSCVACRRRVVDCDSLGRIAILLAVWEGNHSQDLQQNRQVDEPVHGGLRRWAFEQP